MQKKISKDIQYAITKAGLGSIPLVGAAASELFSLLVTPPLEQRRNDWMTEIGKRLSELEKQSEIDFEELQGNSLFIDTVLQTTQLALRSSEKEKLEYYKNALINTALGETPEQSEIQIFLNLIGDFTVWHIKILKLFDNPTEWFRSHNLEVPNIMRGGLSLILETAMPELKGRSEFYNLIWSDLSRAGLHDSGSFQGMITSSDLMANRTTEFGKRFLLFIETKRLA